MGLVTLTSPWALQPVPSLRVAWWYLLSDKNLKLKLERGMQVEDTNWVEYGDTYA